MTNFLLDQRQAVPLVSFPKSGNTWLRFLLANAFKKDLNQAINFQTINSYSPTSFNADFNALAELFVADAPVFVKAHANYAFMPSYNFCKAIYVYRDGFDTLLSYWHFTEAQYPGLYPDIETFSRCYWKYCGHWGDHIASWLNNSSHEVLAISYESMMARPHETLASILQFLDVSISAERLDMAVELSSKKQMKGMAGSAEFMKARKKDFHFVRSAEAGGARKALPEYCKVHFMQHDLNYRMMLGLGYAKPDNPWAGLQKKTNTPINDRIMEQFCSVQYRLKSKLHAV